MIRDGQIVLFSFPQTDQVGGKLRPAVVLPSVPGARNDWLICMVSTQLHQQISEMDEVVRDTDSDFPQTGLKATSLVRVTRIAVVSADLLRGAIGIIAPDRLERIRLRLGRWISSGTGTEPMPRRTTRSLTTS